MNKFTNENWQCGGWDDHEQGQLLAGFTLSFRERLLWLQDADRLAAELETKRPWVDGDGTVHAQRVSAAK